ncbi:MAG: DUF3299 domain-containing protein [Pseudomonadota bacterium]
MKPVVMRALAVMVLLGAVVLVVWSPWTSDGQRLIGSSGEEIIDDGSFRPIADSYNAAPHELVRYQMPPAQQIPPLPEGTAELDWEALWQDGDFTLAVEDGTRVGRPDFSEFPAGTTAEDVMMFFLDIGDMRSLQPMVGAVRDELDGKRVRLAGYTTPVGFSENETRFLLVPELGACIHVPPPPPNQIVYVGDAAGDVDMFAPVWVTGTLKAAPLGTILADVGYQLVDAVAEPYQ